MTRPGPTPFLAASAALFVVFLAAGMPIPLYSLYQAENGVTDAQLATATAAYLIATACSLLLLGRLSDHVGRRPVAVAAVLISLAGAVVMLTVDGLPHLLAGRVLQGLACGLASSAIGSLVVDTAPARPPWLPGVVTATMPPAAVPLGALVSGLLAGGAPHPRVLGLGIAAGALALAAVALVVCAPAPVRRPGALASVRPRATVPDAARPALLGAGAAIVAGWCIGGFYQAFAPAMAQVVGENRPTVVGLLFASAVLLLPVGGLLTGRFTPATAVRIGLAVLLVGYLAAVGLLLTGSTLAPFLVANLVAGIGNGAAVAGATRLLLGAASPRERAGTLATSYLISYAGAALPSLAAGQLSDALQLPVTTTAAGYAVLAGLAAAVAVLGLRKMRAEEP